MVASFVSGCLVVVLGAVAACGPARITAELDLERMLVEQWGITTRVQCPVAAFELRPNDVVICNTTHDGESYRVRRKTDHRRQVRVSLQGSDHMLIPVSVLKAGSGLDVECATERYLRVTLAKPSYCKITGTDDQLRVEIKDLESDQLSWKRIPASTANGLLDNAKSYLAREIETMWGITTPVRCPFGVESLEPGYKVTCDMIHGGETYSVRLEIDDDRRGLVGIFGSNSVLFPVSLVEARAGVSLECATKRYLRAEVGKPAYCKITGSDDSLWILLEDVKTQTWSYRRITAEPIRTPDDRHG